MFSLHWDHSNQSSLFLLRCPFLWVRVEQMNSFGLRRWDKLEKSISQKHQNPPFLGLNSTEAVFPKWKSFLVQFGERFFTAGYDLQVWGLKSDSFQIQPTKLCSQTGPVLSTSPSFSGTFSWNNEMWHIGVFTWWSSVGHFCVPGNRDRSEVRSQ